MTSAQPSPTAGALAADQVQATTKKQEKTWNFLQKPFRLDDLNRAVARLLSGNSASNFKMPA
jgi:DNA-binding NtrC family response regulator